MTEDEIRALQERNAELERQNADLAAERDSLQEENTRLLSNSEALSAELQETKKLNFTLARRTSAETRSAEELLNEMFR